MLRGNILRNRIIAQTACWTSPESWRSELGERGWLARPIECATSKPTTGTADREMHAWRAQNRPKKAERKDFTNAKAHSINPAMNIRPRTILLVAPAALALVSWLPNEAVALDFS